MWTLLGYLVLAGSGILHGVQAASRDDELALISKRRIADLAQFPDPTWFSQISAWLDTQKSDGTWPDVNYMSGCAARKLAFHAPLWDLARLTPWIIRRRHLHGILMYVNELAANRPCQNAPIGRFKSIGIESSPSQPRGLAPTRPSHRIGQGATTSWRLFPGAWTIGSATTILQLTVWEMAGKRTCANDDMLLTD